MTESASRMVLNLKSLPKILSAAAVVRSFMLEAGWNNFLPFRSYKTFPSFTETIFTPMKQGERAESSKTASICMWSLSRGLWAVSVEDRFSVGGTDEQDA